MKLPHVLVIDGYNFLHRSRSGFKLGDHYVTFNFFRSLRALVEHHEPTRVIMVLEGLPQRQLAVDSQYKANRRERIDKDRDSFLVQKDEILEMVGKNFPITLMKHPSFEGDDTIYNVVKNSTRAVQMTVVSTDTDFIQLLNEFENVKVYDPIRKKFRTKCEQDYVCLKSLRGDKSDNVPGIVSEKRALELASDRQMLNSFLKENPEHAERWSMNYELIKFKTFTHDELMNVRSTLGERSWDSVKARFVEFGFKSMTNDSAWNKFVATFDGLF